MLKETPPICWQFHKKGDKKEIVTFFLSRVRVSGHTKHIKTQGRPIQLAVLILSTFLLSVTLPAF